MKTKSIALGIVLVALNLALGLAANIFGLDTAFLPTSSTHLPEVGAVLNAEEVLAGAERAEERFRNLLKEHGPPGLQDILGLNNHFYLVALSYLWALVRFGKQNLTQLYLIVAPTPLFFLLPVLSLPYSVFFAIAPLLVAHAMRK